MTTIRIIQDIGSDAVAPTVIDQRPIANVKMSLILRPWLAEHSACATGFADASTRTHGLSPRRRNNRRSRLLVESPSEFCPGHVQGREYAPDFPERHVALAALDAADERAMQTGKIAEAVLRQVSALPELP